MKQELRAILSSLNSAYSQLLTDRKMGEHDMAAIDIRFAIAKIQALEAMAPNGAA